MKSLLILVSCFIAFSSSAQSINEGREDDQRRHLSKQEITFLENKVDSIRHNLNRMIRFEKQLMQRNYYLDEKTALVQDLIATVQYLQRSVEVAHISRQDIRKIFGKSVASETGKMIYEIETYKSNCPFMLILFTMNRKEVSKVDFKITDCQRWK